MKRTRRHSNTTGARQVRTGWTKAQVQAIARKLGVPYGSLPAPFETWATMAPPHSDGRPSVCLWGTEDDAVHGAEEDERVVRVRVEVLSALDAVKW
jgi:hypothetical protein